LEPKIIFDVATKPFDWEAMKVAAALFLGGCVGILAERFKWPFVQVAIKKVGYFLVLLAILVGGYVSINSYATRRDYVKALAAGRYEVVEGPVEYFHPMYYQGRTEESFTISRRTFRYSEYVDTLCFNQSEAHGGPIHDGMLVRVKFIDECILQIEALPEDSTPYRK
jgi:hypothetical protein